MGGGEEGARRQPCLRLAQFAQVERGAIERAAGVDAAGPLRILVRPAAGVTQGQALIVEEAGEGGAVPPQRPHPAAVTAVLIGPNPPLKIAQADRTTVTPGNNVPDPLDLAYLRITKKKKHPLHRI